MSGFPAQFPVIISHEDGTNTGRSLEYDLIPGYVCAAANQYHINQIKLVGNQGLSTELSDKIMYIASTEYGTNNLEIEVM